MTGNLLLRPCVDWKVASRDLIDGLADERDRTILLASLLTRAREYVADALDAHEHTDGRDLLREIDAALSSEEPPVSPSVASTSALATDEPPPSAPATEALSPAGRWRPKVVAFANLMEAKLRENDWKGGWEGCADLDLFERLGEESAELLSALHRHAKRLSWGDGWVMETDTEERIGREAADVANFAMMIADVCGALSPKAPSPQSGEGEA